MSYTAKAVRGVKNRIVWLNPAHKDFENRVPVNFTRGHFTVKTIESKRELWQVMTLRYEVFHREYMNKIIPFGIDRDRYDQCADHLAIIDNRINRIVGTYRLISSHRSEDFYSKSEFDIADLTSKPGGKVELSRACIHKDYRNGAIITLLWRGIVEYLVASGARWMFGLGSVKTTNPDDAVKVYRSFSALGTIDENYKIMARPGYRIPDFYQRLAAAAAAADTTTSNDVGDLVPTLLKSYIKAGAVVVGDPAIDANFHCTDFFVILDISKLSSVYNRKYQVN